MTLASPDGADVIGTVKADIHQPSGWADIPGFYSFDGSRSNPLRAARAVIERVYFWPWLDESNGEWANWAFVWGNQCMYFAFEAPVCTDVAWAFIDYRNPTLTDIQISCGWEDGIRPPGDETWEVCNGPTAHQVWYPVVGGSLVVSMKQ
jgi:hypothetical protein